MGNRTGQGKTWGQYFESVFKAQSVTGSICREGITTNYPHKLRVATPKGLATAAVSPDARDSGDPRNVRGKVGAVPRASSSEVLKRGRLFSAQKAECLRERERWCGQGCNCQSWTLSSLLPLLISEARWHHPGSSWASWPRPVPLRGDLKQQLDLKANVRQWVLLGTACDTDRTSKR